MTRLTRGAVLLLSTLVLWACAAGGGATLWRESDFVPLPMSGLAGVPVLIYPLVRLNVDSSVIDLPGGTAAARLAADSTIYESLRRRTPQVPWISSTAMQEQAVKYDSLPDLETVDLSGLEPRALVGVRQPLLRQMRALSGISSGRYSFVPAQLALRRHPSGRYRAEMKLVIVDTRVGGVGWASDVAGEGPSSWEAVGAAIWALTGAPGL